MDDNRLYIFIAFFISIPILGNVLGKAKRKKSGKVIVEIVKSNTGNYIFIAMWAILFIGWISFFIDDIRDGYFLLDEKYLDSFYQLFDLTYLKELEEYFVTEGLFAARVQIWLYRYSISKHIFWIFISLTNVFFYLNKSKIKDQLREKAIFSNGIYACDKILRYEWGEYKEEKRFKKKINYYNLAIYFSVKQNSFHYWLKKLQRLNTMEDKIDFRIYALDKEKVDDFLKSIIFN